MTEILEAAGYETVDFHDRADVYIINTCTVTAVADRKSRQMIGRAAEKGGKVCVCGCLAQRDAAAILAHPGVDAVVGSANKGAILEIIRRLQAGEEKIDAVAAIAHALSRCRSPGAMNARARTSRSATDATTIAATASFPMRAGRCGRARSRTFCKRRRGSGKAVCARSC